MVVFPVGQTPVSGLGLGIGDESRPLEDAVGKSHCEAFVTSSYAKEEKSATIHVDIWHLLKTSNVCYVSSYDFG